ncbi:MerR family DNA-binding transcriptional regulator [Streptomyces sp. ST2-7A]|uniref:MerR family DNA-binding transcriptional regulator n=1 Tax=Streptomyces sp. ST2-7A TaxID=2907214 RepID=UPI001F42297A|nr:MerR family DNA-binding transcriptional regulator [Streptomyces sp. ST2-7A]MCE7080211.1 MerR family DNA-binding transcriptional regulator [Streptomyces sp. ST2-7A]
MRPVDLARRAGVAVQTVRNLEAAGVLPAAARTPAGYRRALLTHRALVVGHGHVTARAVMVAVGRDDVSGALALIDASHAAAHAERRSLEEIEAALTPLAGSSPGDGSSGSSAGGLPIGGVARLLGVRPSALRVWERAGLLAPTRRRGTGYRVYAARDVRDARVVHLLRRGGYSLARIRPVVEEVRGAGGPGALRAALADCGAALHARTRAMVAGAARLHSHLEALEAGGAPGAVEGATPAG